MSKKSSPRPEPESTATLSSSRRGFLAGGRLVIGAGAALALGLAGASSKASAGAGGLPFGGQPGGCPGGCPVDQGPASSNCFLAGTRIETPAGPVKIEDLRCGGDVLTAFGEAKSIKWIGRRDLSRNAGAAWPKNLAPVRITRFAIDGKAPHSDLYVSPAHAIYIDGVLIPAHNLVNGATILADARPEMETIVYYHVELETHDAILAEGLAVESFLGNGREAFDNADEYTALYGSLGEPLKTFAPVVSYNGGREELTSHIRSTLAPFYDMRKPLDKIRDRLADRAELARAA